MALTDHTLKHDTWIVSGTTYAAPHSNACSPAAALYFLFYEYLVFVLVKRKNQIQKKTKYRSAESQIANRVICALDSLQAQLFRLLDAAVCS